MTFEKRFCEKLDVIVQFCTISTEKEIAGQSWRMHFARLIGYS